MEQNENKQERKAYAKRGQRSQKMVTFRLDNDLIESLEKCKNKGRFINDAIREKLERGSWRSPFFLPPCERGNKHNERRSAEGFGERATVERPQTKMVGTLPHHTDHKT